MLAFKTSISLLISTLACCGCQAVAEIAYDSQAASEANRCQTLVSYQERQDCMARVKLAQKQAQEVRSKP